MWALHAHIPKFEIIFGKVRKSQKSLMFECAKFEEGIDWTKANRVSEQQYRSHQLDNNCQSTRKYGKRTRE